jgi:hypothetical protein
MDTTDAVADSTEEPAAKKARTDDTEQAAAPAAPAPAAEAPADAAPSAEAPAPAAADAEEEEDDAAKVRVIAGRRFANRDELWAHVLSLQRKIDGGVAEGADAFFLFALVTCHPGANEKLAPGAAKIGFDVNQEYPDTKSFFVERTDGSRAGFSARKCVDELYPKDSTKSALTLGRQSMGAREYKESPQKKARDPPPRGAHVRIDGLTGQAIQYGEIKDALSEFAVPRFVDLNDDEGYAIARFDDNESAVKACACVEIEGAAVTVVVMAPELEDAYRKDADAKREAAREAKRGKGGKGGRGRGKGRGRSIRSAGRGRGRGRGRPGRGLSHYGPPKN